MIRRTLAPLATLSLLTLALATAGCSHRSSPTEPESVSAPQLAASTAADRSDVSGKRHGGDDPAGDDHGAGQAGRGADDPAGNRQGGQQRPARGVEFSGVVSAVDAAAGNLILAGGKKIAVDANTQWNARGDLKSLDQVAAAVAAGKRTRIEGRGTRQAGGAILAQTIKAETGR